MTAAIAIYGDKKLIKALNVLPKNVYARVITNANKKVMSPVLKMAKQLVPVRLGLLKESLGIKTKKYPKKGIIFTLVGPRTGFAKTVGMQIKNQVTRGAGGKFQSGGTSAIKINADPVKYAHFVEFGHRVAKGGQTLLRRDESVSDGKARAKDHSQKLGTSQGFVAAHPFIRPAWDANKANIIPRYKNILWIGIAREAAKLNKGGK